MIRNKNLTPAYAFVQAAFWMDLCVALSFCSVYLKGLGYSNSAAGLVIAVGNLLGALLGPGISSLIDSHERITAAKALPPVLAMRMLMLIVLMADPSGGSLTLIAFTVYIAFSMSVNSLDLKLYVDASFSGIRVDYGIARSAGSFAYVIISLMLGVLVSSSSVRSIPCAAAAVGILQIFAHVLFIRKTGGAKGQCGTKAETGVSLAVFAVSNRRFCLLLAGTVLLFFSHNIVCNFLINITDKVGGDTGSMGILNGFMAAVEIPVMLSFTKLFGGRDKGKILRFAFAVFTFKAAAIALAGSFFGLMSAFLLQAPSFALYTAAIVPYIEDRIPYRDSAKAQSLAFTMTTLSSVLAGTVGGMLYDNAGVSATLWTAAAVCAVGSVISVSGVQKPRE